MILLKWATAERVDRCRIVGMHYKPEQLSDAARAKGMLVESLPVEPAAIKGQQTVLYANPVQRTVWWEHEERPPLPEELAADERAALLARIVAIEARLDKAEGLK